MKQKHRHQYEGNMQKQHQGKKSWKNIYIVGKFSKMQLKALYCFGGHTYLVQMKEMGVE